VGGPTSSQTRKGVYRFRRIVVPIRGKWGDLAKLKSRTEMRRRPTKLGGGNETKRLSVNAYTTGEKKKNGLKKQKRILTPAKTNPTAGNTGPEGRGQNLFFCPEWGIIIRKFQVAQNFFDKGEQCA